MLDASNLVWMDLEMTGLEPDEDVIIEIATIITDANLNTLAEGPVFAIKQPDALLDAMDDWNTKTHGNSGLTQRVKDSRISCREAELATLEFIKQYVPEGVTPLCGNSVHQDRRFLVRYMPELEAYLNYRNIDVSTLKELAKRWRPDLLAGFKKGGSHQALDDIRESISEMSYYREHFIRLD